MVERLTQLKALNLTWSDASITTAHINFSTDAMGVCILPPNDPTETTTHMTLDGVLQLQTDDGRLDGTYPVTAHFDYDSAAPTSLQSISVNHEVYVSDLARTPADFGFVKISSAEVPRPSLSLQLLLDADPELAHQSQITLWRNDVRCEPDPALCSDVFEAAERGSFGP
jgi:hypothetical protein